MGTSIIEDSGTLRTFASQIESIGEEIERAAGALKEAAEEATAYLLDDYSMKMLNQLSEAADAFNGVSGLFQGLVDATRERAELIDSL